MSLLEKMRNRWHHHDISGWLGVAAMPLGLALAWWASGGNLGGP